MSLHYSVQLLNDFECFGPLSTLSNMVVSEKDSDRIDRFLYRTSCAIHSLLTMREAEKSTVLIAREYFKQIVWGENRRIAIACPTLFGSYVHIPAALASIVDMQNQLLPILGLISGNVRSFPSSFREAARKRFDGLGFDENLTKCLQSYWEENGQYLRHLRDVSEHFGTLIDHTFLEYKSEPGCILVLFPDNPEEKAPRKFKFEKEIDAFETIKGGLLRIDQLIGEFADHYSVPSDRFNSSLRTGQMGDLTGEQERTLGLLIEIVKDEVTDGDRKVEMRTIEISQIIPEEGTGNIATRILKLDREI